MSSQEESRSPSPLRDIPESQGHFGYEELRQGNISDGQGERYLLV